MHIMIEIDTDHPEAWKDLRADLVVLMRHKDDNGHPYINAAHMTERVHEGLAPRRAWSGEADLTIRKPDQP